MRDQPPILARGPLALVGPALVLCIVVAAIAAPCLTPLDPNAIVVSPYHGPQAPSLAHPLGTDTLGRDVWARLLYGGRTSLIVGLASMLLSLLVGVIVGVVAGYFGGAIDSSLMWVVDLLLTMPSILLLVVLSTVFPPTLWTVPLVIGSVGWTTFARTARSEVLSVRSRDYVTAARAIGATDARIMWRHVVPAALSNVVVLAALGMSGAITLDAGLSYLGLGVPLPTPSWGRMISEAQTYFAVAPWLVAFPGAAIALTAIGFNLIGQGLLARLEGRPQ